MEIVNPGSQPMHGVTVDVEMTEHQFDFGSAVSVGHVTGDSKADEIYCDTFLKNFNKAYEMIVDRLEVMPPILEIISLASDDLPHPSTLNKWLDGIVMEVWRVQLR